MWERYDLKQHAKASLRANGYWLAFFASLIAGLLGGADGIYSSGNSSAQINARVNQPLDSMSYEFSSGSAAIEGALIGLLPFILSIFAGIFVLSLLYSIFITNPILVGHNRFFMEHRTRKSSIGQLFYGFSNGYMNVVKTVFLRNLFVWLWSLLLVIPGIIKSYQYCMVSYILSENPKMEWRRALELSRHMTDGNKWSIFVLSLSFIGWYLLGVLALGVGMLFVTPYVNATFANLYAVLRQKALDDGFATPEELPGFENEMAA